MSISRREFLEAGVFTLAATTFAACERGQRSPQYQAYLDHISQRGMGLPDGQVLRYIEFPEGEFEHLNTLMNSHLLVLGKDLDSEVTSVPEEENMVRMFTNIVNKAGATKQLTYNLGRVNLILYSNPQKTEFTFDSEVTKALYDWVSSNQLLESSVYTGNIDQHVLIGKFAVNPINPRLINSASASKIGGGGIKTVVTIINTKADAQIYGTPDSALVTELLQGYLNSGGLLQEQQANSVSLAYQYAVK